MSLKHPVERGSPDERGRFDRIAQRSSHFASSPAFFAFCVLVVLAWILGYAFGASSAYEQATGTAITALTLLLVALLRNAELRAEHAIHTKLDALATALREILDDEGSDADEQLERAIGREQEV
jgi:low affinity Fe/Cu permease